MGSLSVPQWSGARPLVCAPPFPYWLIFAGGSGNASWVCRGKWPSQSASRRRPLLKHPVRTRHINRSRLAKLSFYPQRNNLRALHPVAMSPDRAQAPQESAASPLQGSRGSVRWKMFPGSPEYSATAAKARQAPPASAWPQVARRRAIN